MNSLDSTYICASDADKCKGCVFPNATPLTPRQRMMSVLFLCGAGLTATLTFFALDMAEVGAWTAMISVISASIVAIIQAIGNAQVKLVQAKSDRNYNKAEEVHQEVKETKELIKQEIKSVQAERVTAAEDRILAAEDRKETQRILHDQ